MTPIIHCDRRKMTLTERGCAALWGSANIVKPAPAPWEGRHACLHCPIGAGHAGETVNPMAAVVAVLRRICPRCRRVSTRIIGNRLCVSCYNRDREVRTGRNAKGQKPRLILYPAALSVATPVGVQHVRADLVTGPAEIMLARARNATTSMAFGWGAPNA
jgi:hypothetical protein